MVSFDYLSYPTEEDFNDFSYCRPAYYTIKDDQVIIEIYMDKVSGVKNMVARRLNNGLEFDRLARDPDVNIGKNDKDTSVNRKDDRKKSPLLNKHETSFYKKDYTRLYKWL